jgi:K+-sensing histidine kinase KdpD
MTKTFTITAVTALLCMTVLSSCKKETPAAAPQQKTKTELLSDKSWKLTQLEYSTEPTGGTFISTSVSRNASYAFTADHKYTQTAPDRVVESGTWSFNSAETEITLVVSKEDSPTSTITGTFTLTDDNLAILIAGDFTDVNNNGEFINYKQKRLTFTH